MEEETDAHNAFVSRLAIWIRLGLVQRGWLAFPRRLSRIALNGIIEDLWRNPGNLTHLVDAESGARIADLRTGFLAVFNSQDRTSETLDRWLSARFLPIMAAAEAFFRSRSVDEQDELTSHESRTVPRAVLRLIRTMNVDPNVLQIAPHGPTITLGAAATQECSQSLSVTDEEALSQTLSALATPSGSQAGAAAHHTSDDEDAASTGNDPLFEDDSTWDQNAPPLQSPSANWATHAAASAHSLGGSESGARSRAGHPYAEEEASPSEPQEEAAAAERSPTSSHGSESSASRTSSRRSRSTDRGPSPAPSAAAIPQEAQAYIPLGIAVPWQAIRGPDEEPHRRRPQTARCSRRPQGRHPARRQP